MSSTARPLYIIQSMRERKTTRLQVSSNLWETQYHVYFDISTPTQPPIITAETAIFRVDPLSPPPAHVPLAVYPWSRGEEGLFVLDDYHSVGGLRLEPSDRFVIRQVVSLQLFTTAASGVSQVFTCYYYLLLPTTSCKLNNVFFIH